MITYKKYYNWIEKFNPGVKFRYKYYSFWLEVLSKPHIDENNDWVVNCKGKEGIFRIMYSTGEPQKFILEDIIFKDDNA